MEVIEVKNIVNKIKDNVQKVIVGKGEIIDYIMVSILCSGHVLLEDVPGLGKTILARSLSKSINSSFSRIQFTPDLLPSDITGINYYNQKSNQFQFKKGPLMSQLILADEINRATPRTQSSLLKSMEEHQLTVDGITHKLDEPFFVIATQNPIENAGTYPLPEAQLDRFFMKLHIGYPNFDEEFKILTRFKTENPLDEIEAVVGSEDIIKARELFKHVKIEDDLIDYILKLTHKTREHTDIKLGISPRGSQALFRGSQAYAAIQGRDFVTPDDIKAIIKPIFRHRIIVQGRSRFTSINIDQIIEGIVKEVEVPSENIRN
ncbi:MoxR family ATPase [Clostridium sp. D2Q-11]|uniref:MoxR family ATPase n=1 Tax=Anaeromonas frigoriresistens TaxID=2683708 RepID=A0A942Z7M4_9FIRM|nr:MoxR family ATPase [Anaeromonas frigoriresistens]MBS4537110.1 MoxR family ATPase [Anaeromonas frigoriresistens]